MTVLLLGDSHSDIFLRLPNVSRFDLSKCTPYLFTAHRFINPKDDDLWSRLDSWFSSNTGNVGLKSNSLVITSGEIDIRAHYWRHIPRHYQSSSDITEFVKSLATKFYNTLVFVCEKYNLEKIIVWTPPVAGERASYNNEHPFGGSSQTRNKLIHMWNREFANIIKDDQRFSVIAPYYEFIDHVTYMTVEPSPSHDGVHWHDNFGQVFWNNLVAPALNNPGIYFGNNWNLMKDDQFDIIETTSRGTQQYDTWARTDQISDITDIEKHIIINGQSYSWIRSSKRNLLPFEYQELSLGTF